MFTILPDVGHGKASDQVKEEPSLEVITCDKLAVGDESTLRINRGVETYKNISEEEKVQEEVVDDVEPVLVILHEG